MDLSQRLAGNLLQLELDEQQIGVFVRDHVCACGADLLPKLSPHRMWSAECPNCGQIAETGYQKRSQAEHNKSRVLATLGDLKPKRDPRDPDTVLKELGF